MKRISIFVILTGLFLCSPLFSQNLNIGIWQLQNPDTYSNNEMVSFNADSATFCYSTCNLLTGQITPLRGVFTLSGNYLTLTFNNNQGSSKFFLTWINQNKMVLSVNNRNLIFGLVGTYEDQFMTNYFNGIYSTGTYSGSSYGGSNSGGGSSNQICYTCHGTGTCNVCHGSGGVSYYGQPRTTCSACGGDGKCWHCHGTRKQ
jgi:hypothetical protein